MADARTFRFTPPPSQKNLHFQVDNPVTGKAAMVSAKHCTFSANPDAARTAKVFAKVRDKCGGGCIVEVSAPVAPVAAPAPAKPEPVAEQPSAAPDDAPAELPAPPSDNARTSTLDAWIRKNLPHLDPDDMDRDTMKAEIAKATANEGDE